MKKLMYLKRFNEGVMVKYEDYFSNNKVDIKRTFYTNNMYPEVEIGCMVFCTKEGDTPERYNIVDGMSQCIYYNFIDNYSQLKNIEIEPQDLKINCWTQPLFYLCGGYNVLWGEDEVSWTEVIDDMKIFEPDLIAVANKSKNLYELYINLSLLSRKIRKQMPKIIEYAIAKRNAKKFGI